MTGVQAKQHQLKISLLCFGNEWHGDDGFGHAVFLLLQKAQLPKGIALHFCGCNTLHAWNYMKDSNHCILIDALKTDQQPPGELAWYTPDNFTRHSPQHLHDAGVAEFLRHIPILSANQKAPETELLCVTTHELEAFTNTLSTPVEKAVETASQMILQRLSHLQEAA